MFLVLLPVKDKIILLRLDAYNTEMMKLMPNNETSPVSFRDDFRIKEFILDQHKGVEVITSQIDYGLTGKYKVSYALEIFSDFANKTSKLLCEHLYFICYSSNLYNCLSLANSS